MYCVSSSRGEQSHRGPASLGRIRGPLGTPDVTQRETEMLLVNPNFYRLVPLTAEKGPLGGSCKGGVNHRATSDFRNSGQKVRCTLKGKPIGVLSFLHEV